MIRSISLFAAAPAALRVVIPRAIGRRCLVAALLTIGAPAGEHAALATELRMSWNADVGPSNPHMYLPSQMFAQDMLYEGLVAYAKGGQIVPALAERWEIADGGRQFTFHLRRNVRFSDGTPFDAAAVVRNFEHVLGNRDRHAWLELIRQIEAVEAPEDHRFVIRLREPYSGTLQELALIRPLRFLSPSAFPDSGITRDGIRAPIGTGRWAVSEYRRDQYTVFVRNKNYWGEQPLLDRVRVLVIPDAETRLLALERGDLDLIFGDGLISLEAFKRIRDQGRFETFVSDPLFTRLVLLNTKRPAMSDNRVRQAINHAFDRDTAVRTLFHGIEPPAHAMFSRDVPFANLDLEPYRFDRNRARALLDAADWRSAAGQSVRVRNGQRLSLTVAFDASNAVSKALAEILQSDLRAVGVELRLLGEEGAASMRRARAGDFDLLFGNTWGPPYEPAAYLNTMRAATQPGAIALAGLPMRAAIEAAISEAMTTQDPQRQQEAYRFLLTTLHEQATYLPISHAVNVAVLRRGFTGFVFAPQQYILPVDRLRPR